MRKGTISRVMGLTLCFLLIVWAAGCSRLTPEKYDQLGIGMDYAEVVKLLGEPDSCQAAVGFKDCTWGDASQYIKVQFGGNKVVFFSSKGLK